MLLDSKELALRLKALAPLAWATQAALDMALRVREFSIVAAAVAYNRKRMGKMMRNV